MFTINEFGRTGESVELSENGEIRTRFTGNKIFEVDKECFEAFTKFRFDLMHDGFGVYIPCCITAVNRDDDLSMLNIWYGKNSRGIWIDLTIDGKVHPLINAYGVFSISEEEDV